jgi:hypothetical protein
LAFFFGPQVALDRLLMHCSDADCLFATTPYSISSSRWETIAQQIPLLWLPTSRTASIRELAQKPHEPHATFLHCAKPKCDIVTFVIFRVSHVSSRIARIFRGKI